MTDEFETVELEYSEDDILYYLVDEDDNEVGFVIEEDGQEVECYYEEFEDNAYELVEEVVEIANDEAAESSGTDDAGSESVSEIAAKAPTATSEKETASSPEPYVPEKAEDHGYLHKLVAIAGHEGGKARSKAETKLDAVRDKAEVHVDKAKKAASEQAGKAKQIASEQAGKAKEKAAKAKADTEDLGITRESVKETTADLNAIAKEGAETAKELKEAYDDIMESFDFLIPKKVRRRLP